MHGLLDRTYINKLKMSPSYREDSFAREYMSIWAGSSEESWFNYDKLTKYRKIKNPETRAIFRANADQFYLLSVDVGRIHDQSVVTVFRVNVHSSGKFTCTVVNIIVIGRDAAHKSFEQQAIDIKKLMILFNPREVVIDTNGLGIGLGERMTETQTDASGVIYPAYAFHNDDDFRKTQPKDAPQILYSLKASATLKKNIHGEVYQRLNSGLVRFLIKEQEAKSALLATKQGQKMDITQRVKRLMPHEMTTKLFEEMANLRLKKTGSSTDIILEPINTRYPDDKYTSFAYGLWRIKELEEKDALRRKRRGSGGTRRLTFFTGGV